MQFGGLTLVCAADGSAPVLGFDRPTDLDGAPSNVVAAPTEDAAPAHPNGIDGFDHVVIMAPHLDRVRAGVRAAGFEIRRERSDPARRRRHHPAVRLGRSGPARDRGPDDG
ncbi:MAG: hypothetical protein V9G12_01030 [Microthrixaceae bacterium]